MAAKAERIEISFQDEIQLYIKTIFLKLKFLQSRSLDERCCAVLTWVASVSVSVWLSSSSSFSSSSSGQDLTEHTQRRMHMELPNSISNSYGV